MKTESPTFIHILSYLLRDYIYTRTHTSCGIDMEMTTHKRCMLSIFVNPLMPHGFFVHLGSSIHVAFTVIIPKIVSIWCIYIYMYTDTCI